MDLDSASLEAVSVKDRRRWRSSRDRYLILTLIYRRLTPHYHSHDPLLFTGGDISQWNEHRL